MDIFPTLIVLTGVERIPKCKHIDDPPTTQCLQGESYADEFLPSRRQRRLGGDGDGQQQLTQPKQYAFSQWPFQPWGPNATQLREGYSVRSSKGFRYTTYVPYSFSVGGTCKGDWLAPRGDEELYDYNVDPWETVNHATNASYLLWLISH